MVKGTIAISQARQMKSEFEVRKLICQVGLWMYRREFVVAGIFVRASSR
jgi:hypothetical protein